MGRNGRLAHTVVACIPRLRGYVGVKLVEQVTSEPAARSDLVDARGLPRHGHRVLPPRGRRAAVRPQHLQRRQRTRPDVPLGGDDGIPGQLRPHRRPGSPDAGLPAWEPWSNDAGAPKLIVFDADLRKRLVRMDTEELTVEAVRARFDALPEASRKLAASADRTFAFAAPG